MVCKFCGTEFQEGTKCPMCETEVELNAVDEPVVPSEMLAVDNKTQDKDRKKFIVYLCISGGLAVLSLIMFLWYIFSNIVGPSAGAPTTVMQLYMQRYSFVLGFALASSALGRSIKMMVLRRKIKDKTLRLISLICLIVSIVLAVVGGVCFKFYFL